MLATCHENGIQPVVTFHHFTSPRWLFPDGGWVDERTPDRFARYCEKAVNHLGDLISVACTVNEPNIPALLAKLLPFSIQKTPFWQNAAQAFGVTPERLGLWQFAATTEARNVIMTAHQKAAEVIKAGPGDFPVGLTMALLDVQAAEGGEEKAAEYQYEMNDVFLEQLDGKDDFIGVQTYSRMVVGPEGVVHPGDDVEKNQMGEEFYPEALGGTIRYTAKVTGLPVIVTENGLSTEDDSRRVEYFQRALGCVVDTLQEGIDVRGYFAWSAFDNFEWVAGYKPKFGIIAVDQETQERTPKPSAFWLGEVARKNRYPAK
jgi:beta-glucosidase